MVDVIVCLKKGFSFFFFLMLIMFDFNPIVKTYCMKFFFFFTNIEIIHKNKNEIHKNRTLGKKPGQTLEISHNWKVLLNKNNNKLLMAKFLKPQENLFLD